ncbi:tRNA (adenosine(37)-N6)-threonylcarbamoyltransferase complex dimerization subunit type 1 TsaB [bacterium]|nr:tRNA (adenosine(37)-N6)-threonylcarbamoyltransferase complex dimerization subunit type 1 TsaB [bacterium]
MDLDIQAIDNILFLDTSLPYFSASLRRNGKIHSIRELLSSSHSIGLEGRLNRFLAEADTSLDDIENLVYNMGPGSFTGLRIGAAFLSGLSASTNAVLYGVDLYSVVMSNLLGDDDAVYIRNSKKREFYMLTREMADFQLISLQKLTDDPAFRDRTIMYEGTFSYPELSLTSVAIHPKMFFTDGVIIKKVEKGRIIFYYINDPDIRK